MPNIVEQQENNAIVGEVIKNKITSFSGCYLGTPGMGKTLKMILDVYPLLLAGIEVYSNVYINYKGDNLHYFTTDDLLYLTTLRNCVIVFDEAVTILDPRGWAKLPHEIRFFFTQRRKFGVDLFFTAQHISLVEKTARITMDYWAECQNWFPIEGRKGKINKFSKWLPWIVITEKELDKRKIYTTDETVFKDPTAMDTIASTRLISKEDLNHKLYRKYKSNPDLPIYDSKFIIEIDSQQHYYIALTKCKGVCGRTVPYTGKRSNRELELIRELNKLMNEPKIPVSKLSSQDNDIMTEIQKKKSLFD